MPEHTNLLSTIQISKNTSQLLSYLSEITPDDKKLLEAMVKKQYPSAKNYEYSWGYVIQATRYNGFKWYDPYTQSLIFFGQKSKNDKTLIVPLFIAKIDYLTYVVARLQKALSLPQVVLKNVNQEDVSNFISLGFRRYKDNEFWTEEARFDDQTFPQLIVDLKQLQRHFGKEYQNLRTAINKKNHFSIRKFAPTDSSEVISILNLLDNNYHSLNKNVSRDYFESHIMYLTADIQKFVIIDDDTEEIVGFTAISAVSLICSALVAAFFKPRKHKASVWGIYHTLMTVYKQNTYLVNLGGCETKGTHNFMRRTFCPVEQLGKTHIVLDTDN